TNTTAAAGPGAEGGRGPRKFSFYKHEKKTPPPRGAFFFGVKKRKRKGWEGAIGARWFVGGEREAPPLFF
ncbi:hypothetical protein CDT90_003835, partial [Cronobacter sakazakii]